MELREIRAKTKLTQVEAAKLLRISIRSYKDYENNINKKDTLKYNYMCDTLSKYSIIDENHGILSIDEIKKATKGIFNRYNVNLCYLFGSYAKNTANPRSDVNLLIDATLSGLDQFSLLEDIKSALNKKIDIVDIKDLGYKQDILKEVLKHGIKIYR